MADGRLEAVRPSRWPELRSARNRQAGTPSPPRHPRSLVRSGCRMSNARIANSIPAAKPHPNFPNAIDPRRQVAHAVRYVSRTGCPWRHLPRDLSKWLLVAGYSRHVGGEGSGPDPRSTACGGACRRSKEADLDARHHQFPGRQDYGGRSRQGPTQEKFKGRRRPILAEACELLLAVFVSSASVHDRGGASALIDAAAESLSSVEKNRVDGAYVGKVTHVRARSSSPTRTSRSHGPASPLRVATHREHGPSSRRGESGSVRDCASATRLHRLRRRWIPKQGPSSRSSARPRREAGRQRTDAWAEGR